MKSLKRQGTLPKYGETTQSIKLDEIEKQQTILDLQSAQLRTTDKFHFFM